MGANNMSLDPHKAGPIFEVEIGKPVDDSFLADPWQ